MCSVGGKLVSKSGITGVNASLIADKSLFPGPAALKKVTGVSEAGLLCQYKNLMIGKPPYRPQVLLPCSTSGEVSVLSSHVGGIVTHTGYQVSSI